MTGQTSTTCYGAKDSYRGSLAQTTSGKTCQRWDAAEPHEHALARRHAPRQPDGLDAAAQLAIVLIVDKLNAQPRRPPLLRARRAGPGLPV